MNGLLVKLAFSIGYKAGLTKIAGKKLPTSLDTVKKLIAALERDGLKKVRISDIFRSRPKYTLFRGANALPAHAHRTPAKGSFSRNIVDGVRYEHYTPFPDKAHGYGRYFVVTDISKDKGLMSGTRGLAPDFTAMDLARYRGPASYDPEYVKIVSRDPSRFSELHAIVRDPKTRRLSVEVSKTPGGRGVPDQFFEAVVPARYADKHSHVYMQAGEYPYREFTSSNGGFFRPPESTIDEYRRAGSSYADILERRGAINSTAPYVSNPDHYLYDMAPIQRLVKIMHRHPEYREAIEPVVSKYLAIGESGMAGL